MKSRIKLLIRTICLLLFLLPLSFSIAQADSPWSLTDFSVEAPGGKYIFVLLVNENDQSNYTTMGRIFRRNEQLLQKYPHSGMYLNDGSTTPLWTVDWNSYEGDLILSSDGIHIARMGPRALKGHFNEDAITFYKNGVETQRYTVAQLVREPNLLATTVSHYWWRKEVKLDDEKGQLTLITLREERYVFDMDTGKVIENFQWMPTVLQLFGLVVFLLLSILLVIKALRRRRSSKS